MEGNTYYAVLGAFAIMTLFSLKHDKWMFAFIFVALAGWVYYTHETGVTYADLKEDLGKAVDESAKHEYNKKISDDFSEVHEKKVTHDTTQKNYNTDPRYKVGE